MFKMKALLLSALSVVLIGIKAYSADSTIIILKKNTVFTTFGGKEALGSINYERIFSSGKKLNWSYSVGVQPFELSRKFALPVSINTFTNGSLHHLEFDLTATFYMDKFHPYNGGWKDDFNKQLYLTPSTCYRFQSCRGVVFKSGIGPKFVFDPPSDNIMAFKTKVSFPSAFASIGISF